MTAIILKELRENLKWAALGFLGLAAGLLYVLATSNENTSQVVTVLQPAFLMVTSYGFSAVGAAIGALQIAPERRRDQWAALFHRPASSLAIWGAKLLAGMVLFFLTAGTALGVAVIYAALPGRFASPLFPAMLIPACSDLLLGLCAYLASVVLVLGTGSRFVGRVLLAAAFAGIFMAQTALYSLSGAWGFWGTVVGTVLLLAAATESIQRQTGGPRLRLVRAGSILLLVMGAHVLIDFLAPKIEQALFGKWVGFVYEQFAVSRTGEIALETYDPKLGRSNYIALDGTPFSPEESEKWLGNRVLLFNLAWFEIDDATYQRMVTDRGLRSPQDYLRQIGLEGPEEWFLLPAQAWFVGFDGLSRRVEARLGEDGFERAPQSVPPFDPPPRPAYYASAPRYLFWSGPDLYAVDFLAREQRLLLNSGDSPIFGARDLHDRDDAPPLFFVALADEFVVLNADGSERFRKAYARDPKEWTVLDVGANPALDRIYINYLPDRYVRMGAATVDTSVLQVLDSDGEEVDLLSFRMSEGTTFRRGLYASLTPLAFQILSTVRQELFPPVIAAWRGSPLSAADWLKLLLVSLVSATAVWGWGLRVGFSRTPLAGWMLFAFAFGVPGLIAFRFAGDWPPRARCPACKKTRTLQSDRCRRCGAGWPRPEPDGSEVFDAGAVGRAD